ncbi:MAG TPA: sugar phosphate isomerase/epimerase family protein [Armatimonadota bacterium]|nr:sugar phosphate isomerase/epimerase family protein [Armatimonadota bacterium]
MKLGCMLYSLGRSIANEAITVPEALAHIKKSGGEGVDMMESTCANYTASELKTMATDAGLAISSHIGGRSFTQADSETRSEDLDAIKKLIDDSVEMGTDILLVTTGGCAEGQDKADGRRNVASALAEVLPYAKQAGVTLTIEDFGSPVAPYQTGAEVMDTCELAGPDLMVTYDSGNMVMGDEDPVDFLKLVAARTVHAHAKDWALVSEDDARLRSRAGKTYVGTVCGEGVLDYPAVIAELKQMKYQGYVSFEYEGLNDPVENLYQGMAYLGELIAGA